MNGGTTNRTTVRFLLLSLYKDRGCFKKGEEDGRERERIYYKPKGPICGEKSLSRFSNLKTMRANNEFSTREVGAHSNEFVNDKERAKNMKRNEYKANE